MISLDGIVVSTSIKVAGDDFDEAIIRYVRKKHNLLIGERTAEDIKINIGTAIERPDQKVMEVRGRDLVTGLPKTVRVTSEETRDALKETTSQIVEAVHGVLERTPPELAADVVDRGIVLTGGGSLLGGLEELIEEKTDVYKRQVLCSKIFSKSWLVTRESSSIPVLIYSVSLVFFSRTIRAPVFAFPISKEPFTSSLTVLSLKQMCIRDRLSDRWPDHPHKDSFRSR